LQAGVTSPWLYVNFQGLRTSCSTYSWIPWGGWK